MLDSIQLLKEARELGSTKTLADVEAILSTYDYPALREQERTRFRVELWDKVTPINGVSPEYILKDAPEDGEIYLVYVDGNLVYLQKHDPDQIGFVPMTPEVALAKANALVDRLVEEAIDARVKNEVLRQLL
ncbi:MAG: hypothetical protein BAA01_09440 [Bacillus thermozeamaize]|uniref:Uncharacterized protein n=1 Tax=Bacillus thermozeamaize TaxID=230954 RepID=A0A1Y3PEA9_9BACI|nr:MAG: hypothetical protein BAA01_09440 [Bacillus thermozeamaize]